MADSIDRPADRFDLPLLLCAVVAAIVLGWLSVARYAGYNASMLDLGNMAQAIASVGRGQLLVFTYVDGPTSRLALQVELIYYLLALPYAVWPDPRLLLIVQSILFVSAAIPVFQLGQRATGSRPLARCLALVYLLYPVALTAVLFDFHGDTLAMPLLLWAINAADRRAWRSFAVWAALALSCKFYVALPVALLGMLLWWRGERRAGLATFVVAVAYGALAFFVIRPFFSTSATSQAHRGLNYFSFYFGELALTADSWLPRALVALLVFGPALPLAWRGWRWLLPALPVAAAVLVSTGPGPSYHYRYHHYALVVPFIIMACVEGARQRSEIERLANRAPNLPSARTVTMPNLQSPLPILITLLLTALLNGAVVDTPLSPGFWSGGAGRGLDSSAYGVTARDRLKDRWLAATVPAGASLAASPLLAPHLANRDTLYLLSYPDDPTSARLPGILGKVDYAVADGLFDYRAATGNGFVGGVAYERSEIATLLRDPSLGLIAARDGLLLFQRNPPAGAAMAQGIQPISAGAAAGSSASTGAPALLSASITPLGGRRYRARFDWLAPAAPDARQQPIALSELEGVAEMRMLHLPSFALLPVAQWPRAQAMREEFDVELPAELAPGRYAWRVSWYDAANAATITDERSRIGPLTMVETIVVQ